MVLKIRVKEQKNKDMASKFWSEWQNADELERPLLLKPILRTLKDGFEAHKCLGVKAENADLRLLNSYFEDLNSVKNV